MDLFCAVFSLKVLCNRFSSTWIFSQLYKALAQCDNMDCTAGSSVATETSSFNVEHGTINGHPIS
jgi:hypothetical protein